MRASVTLTLLFVACAGVATGVPEPTPAAAPAVAPAAAAVPKPSAVVQDPTGLGPGPRWRGPRRPTAHNEVFATADGCAMCHSGAPRSTAMRSALGEDVSPHALWQASVMANSFRDPYWRAQVAKEVAVAGSDVQALCQRCHAPMVHHGRRLAGQAPTTVAAAATDPLARDGVSCTVCHQIQPDGLGQPATFSGQPSIDKSRRLYGPYAAPVAEPMQMFAGYQVQHGAHVQSSALCGSCHTLQTGHTGTEFPEQTPYLEWRNSVFSDENGATAESRTCQQCHMADLGRTRIARNPGGGDFLIPVREPYRSHAFVGGNAFLLDLLAANRDALGVVASEAALRRNALATRRLLAEDTVAITIDEPVREGGQLRFAVRVDNLTGHKFPSGYPSRRAWLHVQVRAGNQVVWDSGGWTKDGRLADVADEQRQPHRTRVTSRDQVVVWELVAADPEGEPTTYLSRMHRREKDTRLLPKGWRRDGPHAADTAPVGIGTDVDFTAGGDAVDFEVPLAADAPAATVVAWVRYQTIPPHWVDPLRTVDADECRTFVALYDAADKTPETCGVAMRAEARRQ
ncbi:MAG: hypothetical protein JNL08_15250 [Planctomycetes bacterium]|nr:hypothetical protein [Planctomycetota bacterium]